MHRKSSLWFAATLLTACGATTISPENFMPPTVRIRHLGVKNAGVVGGTMNVEMAIYNPNRATAWSSRLEGKLNIDNNPVGDILYTEQFKLKDRDTTVITVPMQFKWTGAGAAAKNVLGYGMVNYAMSGTVWVDRQGGPPFEVPITGQGGVAFKP